MRKKKCYKEDIIYEMQYKDLPDNQEDRIKLILGTKNIDKNLNEIKKEANKLKRVKKHTLEFTWYTILKPAARPRVRFGNRIYVPHAHDTGERFALFCKKNNFPVIDTPCSIQVIIYQKTPTSFSIKKKVLAEMGLIKPCNNTGDVDNYVKTILDAIQHGLLTNDNLVTDMTNIAKRYSIKPRTEVKIEYYDKFPEIWR